MFSHALSTLMVLLASVVSVFIALEALSYAAPSLIDRWRKLVSPGDRALGWMRRTAPFARTETAAAPSAPDRVRGSRLSTRTASPLVRRIA